MFSTVQLVVFGPRTEDVPTDESGLRPVPPLAGLTIDAANARLREHGFVPGLPTLGRPAPSGVEPGTVSGSSPGAGELAEENSVILPVVWGLPEMAEDEEVTGPAATAPQLGPGADNEPVSDEPDDTWDEPPASVDEPEP